MKPKKCSKGWFVFVQNIMFVTLVLTLATALLATGTPLDPQKAATGGLNVDGRGGLQPGLDDDVRGLRAAFNYQPSYLATEQKSSKGAARPSPRKGEFICNSRICKLSPRDDVSCPTPLACQTPVELLQGQAWTP